jgi:hypothetical protein
MPSGTGTTVTISMQCGWPTWLSSVRLGFCALGLIAFSHFSYKLWSTTLSTGINTKVSNGPVLLIQEQVCSTIYFVFSK